MPSPDWYYEEGMPCPFTPVTTRQYRGTRLAGAAMSTSVSPAAEITVQEWELSLYQIGIRLLRFFQKIHFTVIEKRKGLRLEAVLSGELNLTSASGKKARLRAGEYHVTDTIRYRISSKKDSHCQYFVSYFPDELLRDFAVEGTVAPNAVRSIPEAMLNLLHEALHNPYEEKVRNFYYQNLIRDLFFIHLTSHKTRLPDELTEDEIAAVYQADAILAADLGEHYTIRELSGMAGTNAFKLKRGFRLIFKTGVFGRLLYKRMEQAKLLLATTSKPIKEVAFEAGYATVAGFITAFRKRFGMTPLEWREQQGGSISKK